MPSTLFNRDIDINIDGLRIASRLLNETRQRLGLKSGERSDLLAVTFNISKNIKGDPNSAEITVLNLGKNSRTRFQKKKARIVLKAGYLNAISNMSTIFDGELEFGGNSYNGIEWSTKFQSGDGIREFQSARICKSFSGKVNAGDMLREAVKSLGIDPGNMEKALASGGIRGAIQEFQNGFSMSGKAEKSVQTLAKKLGFDFSIQDGKAMFLGPNDTVDSQVVQLSASTGMIGAPEQGEDGIIKVRSLIQPGLLPGKRVSVASKQAGGFFRINKVDLTGATWQREWYADMECKPL